MGFRVPRRLEPPTRERRASLARLPRDTSTCEPPYSLDRGRVFIARMRQCPSIFLVQLLYNAHLFSWYIPCPLLKNDRNLEHNSGQNPHWGPLCGVRVGVWGSGYHEDWSLPRGKGERVWLVCLGIISHVNRHIRSTEAACLSPG